MIECRICLEDSTNEQLISPCGCDGTAKWVHESCLQRWREENVSNDNARRCEICNVHYFQSTNYMMRIDWSENRISEWHKNILSYILLDFLYREKYNS